MRLTKEYMRKVRHCLEREYDAEQLRDFIVKCAAHQAMLIISMDPPESRNGEREAMIKVLAELQAEAIKCLEGRKVTDDTTLR